MTASPSMGCVRRAGALADLRARQSLTGRVRGDPSESVTQFYVSVT